MSDGARPSPCLLNDRLISNQWNVHSGASVLWCPQSSWRIWARTAGWARRVRMLPSLLCTDSLWLSSTLLTELSSRPAPNIDRCPKQNKKYKNRQNKQHWMLSFFELEIWWVPMFTLSHPQCHPSSSLCPSSHTLCLASFHVCFPFSFLLRSCKASLSSTKINVARVQLKHYFFQVSSNTYHWSIGQHVNIVHSMFFFFDCIVHENKDIIDKNSTKKHISLVLVSDKGFGEAGFFVCLFCSDI